MRLFILGNGFDLFHGLPTRYADFMLFMRRRYPQVVEDYLLGIDRYSLPYFGQVAQMPQDILWNDMERIFGSYEIWEMVEEHRDWNSPHDYTGPASERLHRILHLPIRIHEFLTEWLQTLQPQIQQTKPRPALQRLFGAGEDLFLFITIQLPWRMFITSLPFAICMASLAKN